MSFASLKKNRTSSFDKLNSQLQSMSNQKMSKGGIQKVFKEMNMEYTQ